MRSLNRINGTFTAALPCGVLITMKWLRDCSGDVHLVQMARKGATVVRVHGKISYDKMTKCWSAEYWHRHGGRKLLGTGDRIAVMNRLIAAAEECVFDPIPSAPIDQPLQKGGFKPYDDRGARLMAHTDAIRFMDAAAVVFNVSHDDYIKNYSSGANSSFVFAQRMDRLNAQLGRFVEASEIIPHVHPVFDRLILLARCVEAVVVLLQSRLPEYVAPCDVANVVGVTAVLTVATL